MPTSTALENCYGPPNLNNVQMLSQSAGLLKSNRKWLYLFAFFYGAAHDSSPSKQR